MTNGQGATTRGGAAGGTAAVDGGRRGRTGNAEKKRGGGADGREGTAALQTGGRRRPPPQQTSAQSGMKRIRPGTLRPRLAPKTVVLVRAPEHGASPGHPHRLLSEKKTRDAAQGRRRARGPAFGCSTCQRINHAGQPLGLPFCLQVVPRGRKRSWGCWLIVSPPRIRNSLYAHHESSTIADPGDILRADLRANGCTDCQPNSGHGSTTRRKRRGGLGVGRGWHSALGLVLHNTTHSKRVRGWARSSSSRATRRAVVETGKSCR